MYEEIPFPLNDLANILTCFTDQLSMLLIWAWTEHWIVLIATSIPALWPIFKKYFQMFQNFMMSSKHRGYSSSESDPNGNRVLDKYKVSSWTSRRKQGLIDIDNPDNRTINLMEQNRRPEHTESSDYIKMQPTSPVENV